MRTGIQARMTGADTLAVIESGRLIPFGLDPFRACRENGLRTVLVTNDLDSYLGTGTDREIMASYVDDVVKADTTDVPAVVDALRDLHATGRLCGVFSVTDYSVRVIAEVAEALGLPGLSPSAARNARQKGRQRQLCAAANVPIPAFVWAKSAEQAHAAAERLGSPCVVKPLSEAAGLGVRLCHTPAEAARHFAVLDAARTDRRGHPREPGALVEEYLTGYEVSVEIVHAAGGHQVIGVTDKMLGSHPYFVELGETYPSVLPDDVQRACGDVARRALAAIGHDFGAAHVEVKVTSTGPKLIEVNARMGGAQITRLVHEASGVHLPREVIRMHAGLRPDLAADRRRAAASRYLTNSATGVLTAVRGLELARAVPGVTEVQAYVEAGDRIRGAESNADVVGHVIAVGQTPGEAVRRVDTALGQLSLDIEPPAG